MSPYRIRNDIPEEVVKELGQYSPLMQKLLFHRGITTQKAAEVFLNPDWERDQGDPFEIEGMEKV